MVFSNEQRTGVCVLHCDCWHMNKPSVPLQALWCSLAGQCLQTEQKQTDGCAWEAETVLEPEHTTELSQHMKRRDETSSTKYEQCFLYIWLQKYIRQPNISLTWYKYSKALQERTHLHISHVQVLKQTSNERRMFTSLTGVMRSKTSAVKWTVNEARGLSNLYYKTRLSSTNLSHKLREAFGPGTETETKQKKSAGNFYLVQMLWTFYKNVDVEKEITPSTKYQTGHFFLDIIR